MASIIMPSGTDGLADEDIQYAIDEEPGRGRMAAFGASIAAIASRRATKVTAAVVSVAAVLVVSAGPITQALSQAGSANGSDNGSSAPASAAAVAAGGLAPEATPLAPGSLDSLGSDRASSTSLPVADRNRPSKETPSSTTGRANSEPAERPTPAAPTLPVIGDLSRALPTSLTAQLDSVVRAGTAKTIAVSDLGTNGSFKASATPGTLDQPSNPARALRPVLIGDAPRAPYPEALRTRGRERAGQAILEFTVDTAGRVDMSTVTEVQSDHDAFTTAARSVLPALRFFPAQQAGKKVRSVVRMPFHFSINNNNERT
jgi:protein TonB